MSPEKTINQFPKEIIIMPQGPQGPKVGLQIESEQQLDNFRKAIAPIIQEKNVGITTKILETAKENDISVVDL